MPREIVRSSRRVSHQRDDAIQVPAAGGTALFSRCEPSASPLQSRPPVCQKGGRGNGTVAAVVGQATPICMYE